MPPEDVVSGEQFKRELDSLYRGSAPALAEQLSRVGAKDGLDLVHEAFARVLALARPKRSSIEKPRAYLATISRNLHKDEGRQQANHQSWLDDAATAVGLYHDPVAFLEDRDRLRRLEAALLKLRPITRDVFVARRVEDLSYAEISERMGLSANAIEKHMAKAIAKLSRLMDRA